MSEIHTIDDPDPLAEFEFERGDAFTDKHGDQWGVVRCTWQFHVSYRHERDGVPRREDHRVYWLRNDNMELSQVPESELRTWEVLDD